MNEIKKVLCLVVLVAVMLISTASAIAEHSKAETVERMKMPELQSAGNGNASAIEAHPGILPSEVTPPKPAPSVPTQTQTTQALNYVIYALKLTSPPSYIVTADGHKYPITLNETVGIADASPPMQMGRSGLTPTPGMVADLAGCYWGCGNVQGFVARNICINDCIDSGPYSGQY